MEGIKSALLAAKGIPSAGMEEGGWSTRGGVDGKKSWTEEEKTVRLKAFGRGYAEMRVFFDNNGPGKCRT